ncbi:hypothetical protein MPSEU_000922500 [Mayamaea pseudoterrestris]|nr:hypothetical protein MPSEU_000922500 [Mayamaea pseudoterrestris]
MISSMSMSTSATPVLVRLMLPEDANPGGTVHGGCILQLMEQAGVVASTRFVHENGNKNGNNDTSTKLYSVLVRLEHMRFWKPLHVGQLASVSATIAYTSQHSMLVKVTVTAEDFTGGEIKQCVTNTGDLWYVALQQGETNVKVINVPSLMVPATGTTEWKHYQSGLQSYQARKQAKLEANDAEANDECFKHMTDTCFCRTCRANHKPPELSSSSSISSTSSNNSNDNTTRTPSDSTQHIHRVVLPSNVIAANVALAGFVMKEMDNCAGASAVRHARSASVVTVAIPHIEFSNYVKLGTIVNVSSKVTFCSAKSMEVQVVATVTSLESMTNELDSSSENNNPVVAKGIFSFVSLNDSKLPMAVPSLRLETEHDMQAYYEGQQRYERAKLARAATVT